MTAGVPQGSVLGPLLWNLLYDGLFRMQLPRGAFIVGYADDLGVVIKADTVVELNRKAKETLDLIQCWMNRNGLSLAPEKSEAMIVRGPRKRDDVVVCLGGETISIRKEVKYLGIWLDSQGTFRPHVAKALGKASKKAAALGRLMRNVGSPTAAKRPILNLTVESTFLYGSSVWHGALRISRYRAMAESLQRRCFLRVVSGYRTLSARALQVISVTPPVELLIEERRRLEQDREVDSIERVRARERRLTISLRQDLWDRESTVAQWTKKLIPNIQVWYDCKHRQTNYFLTQFLGGHGSFGTYTCELGRR